MSEENPTQWMPQSTEHTHCALCESDDAFTRPSESEMADFYRIHYRTQPYLLPKRLNDGRLAQPNTPEYDLAVEERGQRQANMALKMGETKPGDRVLDVGCRRGQTLLAMKDKVDIEAVGIEPGETDAQMGIENGIDIHVGVMETYDPGERKFDQIQMFHVLEHMHDPVATLIRLRSWLKPNGRLVIEVPDMMKPYGGLQFFFQYPHLYSFSPNTLVGLFRRAGLEPVRIGGSGVVMLVGTPMANAGPMPRPFSIDMLPFPDHNGAWVSNRLLTYNGLEKVLQIVRKGANVPVELVTKLVSRECLPPKKATGLNHTCKVTMELIEILIARRQFEAVSQILTAVIQGPHPPGFIAECKVALQQTNENLARLKAGWLTPKARAAADRLPCS